MTKKVENIVAKGRNCMFCAISSFVTMFSKSRLLQRRQKASIWGKGLNPNQSDMACCWTVRLLKNYTECLPCIGQKGRDSASKIAKLSPMTGYLKMSVTTMPSPGSSVGSDAGFQLRGCEFESRLGQLSFRGLTKVNATCVIPLPPMGWAKSMWKSSQLLGKIVVWSTGVRKPGNAWVGELAAVI